MIEVRGFLTIPNRACGVQYPDNSTTT